MKKYLFILSTMLASSVLSAENEPWPLQGKSFFSPRSQSTNAARDAVGWHRFINKNNRRGFSGAFAITPEYNRAYKTRQVAEYFFGTDTITISGSTIANRGTNDILADYFGLSTDYQSCVHICPKVQNALIDFALYLAWGPVYFRIHAPYVWNQTEMELIETTLFSGSDTLYPAFYMAQAEVQPPAQTFKQAMTGGFTWGNVQEGLKFGKVACAELSENKLSDIEFALGWNFLQRERGVVGGSLRASAPTGTIPTSTYLLEPIVGSGHHWQCGVGFNMQGLIWEKDADQRVDLIFDINIMHLFKSRQIRSFDLQKNGFGSRYILVKEFNENGAYTGKSQPLINITSLPCLIDAAAQIDFIIMFGYQNSGCSFDIGYNGWIRTAEGVELDCCFAKNRWGLKGIANVANIVGPVNDTQSSATIQGNALSEQAMVIDDSPPVFINTCDLDLRSGAASRQFTHKLFAHGSYAWIDMRYAQPYVGLGFSVEFAGKRPKDLQPNKNSMSMWAFWLKTGAGF